MASVDSVPHNTIKERLAAASHSMDFFIVKALTVFTSLITLEMALQRQSPRLGQSLCYFFAQQPLLWTYLSLLGQFSPTVFGAFARDLVKEISAHPSLFAFTFLALFKGIKIIVHLFSYYFLTRPAQPPIEPTVTSSDVTVIIPTVGNFDHEFKTCILSILANHPAQIIISTVGKTKHQLAEHICKELDLSIKIVSINKPNKRHQFLHAVNHVKTKIISTADDHVFWPPGYLRSSLAPFENEKVGIVGTAKKVLRDKSGDYLSSFLNYIACIYLERHNFECTSTYNLDGGVFVISGRTNLVRASIIQDKAFQEAYLNEMWWWGKVGPLGVDDDNFTTRWMADRGWHTVFHNDREKRMLTTLGTTGGVEKFRGQLIRWARTTWRSNSTSLFCDRTCWTAHPWTTYAAFITSFVNLALPYDAALFGTLYAATGTRYLWALAVVLFLTKLYKPLQHLREHPTDIGYFFGGILFGYLHSLVRIWALITCRSIEWSGRKNIDKAGEEEEVV